MSDEITYEIGVRIHSETLEKNVKRILGDKLKEAISDDVKKYAATRYARKVEHYVPMSEDGGTLRRSTRLVHIHGTWGVEYDPVDKYGRHYGEAQYKGPSWWNRYTEDTYSHWNSHLTRAEREEYYREVADEILKRANKHG